jgi:hypothetical protein
VDIFNLIMIELDTVSKESLQRHATAQDHMFFA